MYKNIFLYATAAVIGFSSVACSNDDDHPAHIHDHDDIHELVIKISPEMGNQTETYSFHHDDQMGEMITLAPNTTYFLEISELNVQHNGNLENHLHEIIEHKDEHIFLYRSSAPISLERIDDATTTRTDGNQLGVKTRITTGDTSAGFLEIELKHNASSVSATDNNNMGSAIGGATDLLARFGLSF
ncbi:MAG: hypothetical protein Q4F57_07435 [Weeksellaceae bacterium]|nr:hypothetical protein [Weeksellaceae bacterium]